MNKTSLLSCCLKINYLFFLFPLSLFAQDSVHMVPNMSPGASVLHWQRTVMFIDITQNFWLNKPDEVKTKFISGGFNVNLAYEIRIVKNIFSIAPGLGFSNATVKNNTHVEFSYDSQGNVDSTMLIPSEDTSYLKSKISASYLDVPVELRFRIKPSERGKNFWIAPGFRAGILVSDFWKYKANNFYGNSTGKFKLYQIPNMESFHYGISLRAGFYKFGVYAYYSLTDLFEKGKGTELTPFSVGICFTPL